MSHQLFSGEGRDWNDEGLRVATADEAVMPIEEAALSSLSSTTNAKSHMHDCANLGRRQFRRFIIKLDILPSFDGAEITAATYYLFRL